MKLPTKGAQLNPHAAKDGQGRLLAAAATSVGEDGFVSYDELSPAEVKELANAVNALSEPLSRLTAAVLA